MLDATHGFPGAHRCSQELETKRSPDRTTRFAAKTLYPYNRQNVDEDFEKSINSILRMDGAKLFGGLCAEDGDVCIGPNCCCGLEGWRDWYDILNDGSSPWLGHDPTPEVKIDGKQLRILSDDSLEPESPELEIISTDLATLREALLHAEIQLRAFSETIESFISTRAPSLAKKMRTWFLEKFVEERQPS